MNAFTPMMVDGLSNREKMAFNLLVIIKEKRCGKFKGIVVTTWRKQRATVLERMQLHQQFSYKL